MPALVLAKRQQKLWRCSRAVCPRSLRVQVQWPPKTPHLNWTPSPTASPSSSLVPSPHVPCDYVILESSDFTLICTPWHICSLFSYLFVYLLFFFLICQTIWLPWQERERNLPCHSYPFIAPAHLINLASSPLLSLFYCRLHCCLFTVRPLFHLAVYLQTRQRITSLEGCGGSPVWPHELNGTSEPCEGFIFLHARRKALLNWRGIRDVPKLISPPLSRAEWTQERAAIPPRTWGIISAASWAPAAEDKGRQSCSDSWREEL